jgi:hypothetical protein
MKPLTQLLINCVRETSLYDRIRHSSDPINAALEIANQNGLNVLRSEIEAMPPAPSTPSKQLEALSLCRFNWIRVEGMLACGSGEKR